MKYFLIAADPISSSHASLLIERLQKNDVRAEIAGIGDFRLEGEDIGISTKNRTQASPKNSISNFFSDRLTYKIAKRKIVSQKPDVLIIVGLSNLNLGTAKFARKKGIRTLLIANPDVIGRLSTLNKPCRFVDRVFVTLPSDLEVVEELNVTVDFIGNPVLDLIGDFQFDSMFALDQNEVNIAVLPGEDRKEFSEAVRLTKRLAAEAPNCKFHMTSIDNSSISSFGSTKNANFRKVEKYELMRHCNVAISLSSLETLEAVVLNCPQVFASNKKLDKEREWSSLVNFVAKKEVVKELGGRKYNVHAILDEINLILKDQHYCATMLDEYQEVKNVIGHERASKKAARIIVDWLEESSSS